MKNKAPKKKSNIVLVKTWEDNLRHFLAKQIPAKIAEIRAAGFLMAFLRGRGIFFTDLIWNFDVRFQMTECFLLKNIDLFWNSRPRYGRRIRLRKASFYAQHETFNFASSCLSKGTRSCFQKRFLKFFISHYLFVRFISKFWYF